MGKSHQDIIAAFDKGATSGEGSHIFIDGGTVYSYGYHFPLAKRIGTREYLINPDSYSVSTSKHQRYVSRILTGTLWFAPDCEISQIPSYYESLLRKTIQKTLRSRKPICSSVGMNIFPRCFFNGIAQQIGLV